MKKILIFGITENPGGVESVIMNYYRNIDRNRIQFDFLCNSSIVAYEDEIKELGGNIYRITPRSKSRKTFYEELNSFFKIYAKEYSAIWVNVCSLANIDYLIMAKKYGIKCRIIHSHNSQNMDSFLRKILHIVNKLRVEKYATDFWSCSKESSDWFYNKKIINCSKYRLINNAIDLSKYQFNESIRKEYREKLNLQNNLIIGNIARFHFQKNHPFIIKIFSEIVKLRDDARLILVGQGEDREKIEMMVKEEKLDDKVIFMGVRNDVDKLIQAMDVFVFPSLFEGIPVTLIEAQASGIPILASEEGVPAEAKMAKNLYFFSLNKSSREWADEILKISHFERNCNCIQEIQSKGYDIKNEVVKLQNFLEGI